MSSEFCAAPTKSASALRGVGGRLAAVGQRADFDRLYSRFAAW